MNCSHCQGLDELFSAEYVDKEVANYHKRGPDKTTRMLTNALKQQGVEELTLLDIGGGVGAIQYEMLDAGAKSATDVEASTAYLAAAKSEGQKRGYAERINYHQGNFVDLAEQLQPADIVTLDRVICCYPDMQQLVGLSAARAGKLYGVVYPRDTWWLKIGLAIQNFFFRLQKNPFRVFIHPSESVEAIIIRNGFKRRFYKRTLVWQVIVYAR
jgi:hypothetical protein